MKLPKNILYFLLLAFSFSLLAFTSIAQQIPLQQNLLQHVASPYAASITNDVNPQNTRVDSIFKGRCYNLDGVDDYVLPPISSFQLDTFPFAISFWVRTNVQNTLQGLFDIDGATGSSLLTNGQRLRIYFSSASNIFCYWASTGAVAINENSLDFDNGDWYHFSLVRRNDSMITYVNGQFSKSDTTRAYAKIGNNTQRIGALGSSNRLNGNLYDYRVYKNSKLNNTQIDSIYNFQNLSQTPTLWYRADEGAGNLAYDASGNGNHATITNATEATFHATDLGVKKSWLNDVGYLNQNDTLIPIVTGATAANGTTTTNTGKVKLNAALTGSNCANFDGVDDYIQLSSEDTLKSNFSFGLWCNYDNTAGASIIGSVGNSYLGLNVVSNGINYRTLTSFTTVLTDIINTGTWYHVVVVNGSDSTKFYLNGILQDKNSNQGNFAFDRIGKGLNGVFNGKVSSVFFINDTLTDNDVFDIYTGNINKPNLCYLPLAEGTGSTAYDASGNGNHGTITNATLTDFWSETQNQYHYNLEKGFGYRGAMYFDGDNDYAEFTNIDAGSTYAVAVKFKYNSSDASGSFLAGFNANMGVGKNGASGIIYRTTQTLNLPASSIKYGNWSGYNFKDNQYHTLVLNSSNNNITFFMDGVLSDEERQSIEYDANFQYLGNRSGLTSDFNGEIMEVGIWVNDTLTSSQIANLSNGFALAKANNLDVHYEGMSFIDDTTMLDLAGSNNAVLYSEIPIGTKIPALATNTYLRADSTSLPTSNPATYAGRTHNGAETTIQLNPYNAPSLVNLGIDSSYTVGYAGTSLHRSYQPNIGYIDTTSSQVKNILTYQDSTPLMDRRVYSQQDYFDTSATKLFNTIASNGSTISYKNKILVNQTINNLSGYGEFGSENIFSKMDILYFFGMDDTIQAKLNWTNANYFKATIDNNSKTFIADTGFSNESFSTGYNSNYNPSTSGVNYTLNANSFGIYGINLFTNIYIIGNHTASTPYPSSGIRNVTSNNDYYINNSSYDLGFWPTSSEGFYVVNRNTSSNVKTYHNGILNSDVTHYATGIGNNNFHFGARGNTAVSSPGTFKMGYVGGIINNHSQLYNSVEKYFNSK